MYEFDRKLYEEAIFKNVNKADLAEYLGEKCTPKIKKTELVGKLKQQFAKDPLARRRYCKKFQEEVAIWPNDVETILGCTKTERKRWTQEGKLPVVSHGSFTYGEFPLYDRLFIDSLPKETIAKWREDHNRESAQHRAAGAKQAAESRKKNEAARTEFQKELEATVKSWNKSGLEKGAMLELAYWTMWASHWAKENQRKIRTARTRGDIYEAAEKAWYEQKNEAIKILASSKYSKLSFYEPEYPDKLYFHMCEDHFEEYREMRHYGMYESVYEAYHDDPGKYNSCPDCVVERDEGYYSLYYLEIEDGDWRLSFHTPYPIGKLFLPSKELLPSVQHEENDEGMFRFGRPITEEEAKLRREKFVWKKLEEALAKAKLYSNAETANKEMEESS